MRVVVTGARGFLGWHTLCALRARCEHRASAVITRAGADPSKLAAGLRGSDVVLHLAGVNRGSDQDLRLGNLGAAEHLTAALDVLEERPLIVYADSIQSGNGSPFGQGKRHALDHLRAWSRASGGRVADVRLPNLFGEHGRPFYNSVVATFCHQLANHQEPTIIEDRQLPLLHAQDAADLLITIAELGEEGVFEPPGRLTTVSELDRLLRSFHETYVTGELPARPDGFHRALFNTYRSFRFPAQFPIHPELHSDARGRLFECVRSHDGEGQVFCSTTQPGMTRGEHFHLRKLERFVVLSGRADIAVRRLYDQRVVRFSVSADRPSVVDMPTMWAHCITNTGSDELITMFWTDQLLSSDHLDTHPEQVAGSAAS